MSEPSTVDPADWSYSGDPASSDRDAVRFLIGDTDAELRLLADAEVTYLLDTWLDAYGSVVYVASVAASMVATKLTGVVSISADGVSVQVGDLAERYRKLAEDLRALYKAEQTGGELDLANLLVGQRRDPSLRPLVFGIGLHDNWAAGQQDYGGVIDPFTQAQHALALYGTLDA